MYVRHPTEGQILVNEFKDNGNPDKNGNTNKREPRDLCELYNKYPANRGRIIQLTTKKPKWN